MHPFTIVRSHLPAIVASIWLGLGSGPILLCVRLGAGWLLVVLLCGFIYLVIKLVPVCSSVFLSLGIIYLVIKFWWCPLSLQAALVQFCHAYRMWVVIIYLPPLLLTCLIDF